MSIESHKQFLIIVHCEAPNAEKAIKRWRDGEVVGLIHRLAEIRELASSIGFDMGQREWSDYEPDVPEMGFKRPKTRAGRKKK